MGSLVKCFTNLARSPVPVNESLGESREGGGRERFGPGVGIETEAGQNLYSLLRSPTGELPYGPLELLAAQPEKACHDRPKRPHLGFLYQRAVQGGKPKDDGIDLGSGLEGAGRHGKESLGTRHGLNTDAQCPIRLGARSGGHPFPHLPLNQKHGPTLPRRSERLLEEGCGDVVGNVANYQVTGFTHHGRPIEGQGVACYDFDPGQEAFEIGYEVGVAFDGHDPSGTLLYDCRKGPSTRTDLEYGIVSTWS
jgi:hypothetical protein